MRFDSAVRMWSLSSGSSGNCYLLKEGNNLLLLEAGINMARIQKEMAHLGAALSQLIGVVVTHEHGDHWQSACPLSRKLKVPLVCSPGTLEAGQSSGPAADAVAVRGGGETQIGPFRIQAFSQPHDARESLGFVVHAGGSSICLATDMGAATGEMVEHARRSDLVILEANHDVDMLTRGPYPAYLKSRILGDRGHLSNEAAGEALIKIADGRPRDFWLAHLSNTNNTPKRAMASVQQLLRKQGLGQVRVSVALRDQRSLTWDSEFSQLEQLPLF
ncbi:MAG TPA: MBL fold metallo-hydrolase [Chloroflexota bacterium]|nr:MBL fold metallo-hydrolase [Chloroflexota bacterium]